MQERGRRQRQYSHTWRESVLVRFFKISTSNGDTGEAAHIQHCKVGPEGDHLDSKVWPLRGPHQAPQARPVGSLPATHQLHTHVRRRLLDDLNAKVGPLGDDSDAPIQLQCRRPPPVPVLGLLLYMYDDVFCVGE